MKFIISNTTAQLTNIQLAQELSPLASMFGRDGYKVIDAIRNDGMKEITHLKNMSLTLANGEWIFEINDDLMFKHISLIGKVIRFIAPIAMSLHMLMFELKNDLESINDWLNERK